MFSVGVRDHVMIAHSFKGEVFGPAQGLHGATYVVDVEFCCAEISNDGIVVDIGRAHAQLKAMLAQLNYRNLDEASVFAGKNTTTEFLAHHIFMQLRETVRGGELGPGGENVSVIKVTLRESHIAWASYEGKV